MLLLPASIFVSTLVFILSLLPSVSALCLPCQAAFRRPDFLQRWTLDSRDSGAAPTIPILNPSYRSVWLNGELQLVTWYIASLSMLAAFSECQTDRNTTGVNPRADASECQVYLGQWDWNTRDYRKVFFGNLALPFRIVWSPHCFQTIRWLRTVAFATAIPLSECQRTTSSDLAIIGLSSVSDTYCSLTKICHSQFTLSIHLVFTLNSEGHSAPFTIAAPPKDQWTVGNRTIFDNFHVQTARIVSMCTQKDRWDRHWEVDILFAVLFVPWSASGPSLGTSFRGEFGQLVIFDRCSLVLLEHVPWTQTLKLLGMLPITASLLRRISQVLLTVQARQSFCVSPPAPVVKVGRLWIGRLLSITAGQLTS